MRPYPALASGVRVGHTDRTRPITSAVAEGPRVAGHLQGRADRPRRAAGARRPMYRRRALRRRGRCPGLRCRPPRTVPAVLRVETLAQRFFRRGRQGLVACAAEVLTGGFSVPQLLQVMGLTDIAVLLVRRVATPVSGEARSNLAIPGATRSLARLAHDLRSRRGTPRKPTASERCRRPGWWGGK
jgi:hypothetical protein